MAVSTSLSASGRSRPAFARGTNDRTDEQQRRAVRAAMLSVYHHSIGRRLELRGAQAVLMPPDAEPLSLDKALDVLASTRPRLREAIWTVARSVAPARPGVVADHICRADRYPRALRTILRRPENRDLLESLERYDGLRSKYRQQAHLFSSALIAFAQADPESESNAVFGAILRQLETSNQDDDSLDEGTRRAGVLGGSTFSDYLRRDLGNAVGDDRKRSQRELRRLESELGINLATYVQEFADAVAFVDSFGHGGTHDVRVYPATSVTVQDAASLQTQVTVTALVSTQLFDGLRIGMDPQCWSMCSDAFRVTRYVKAPFDLSGRDPMPAPGVYDEETPLLLEEDVTISWGADESEIGSFRNVLNINTREDHDNRIEISFDLNRSITSRVLWDERAGGILVDEGYMKARPVAGDVWRVTTRKTIRFSDRTPYSGGPGWNDFGQVLNYLAPAALSWWIENEMYSATCPEILEKARAAQAAPPAKEISHDR